MSLRAKNKVCFLLVVEKKPCADLNAQDNTYQYFAIIIRAQIDTRCVSCIDSTQRAFQQMYISEHPETKGTRVNEHFGPPYSVTVNEKTNFVIVAQLLCDVFLVSAQKDTQRARILFTNALRSYRIDQLELYANKRPRN